MIADLDDTIRELLMAELPIRNSEIDINFDQPKREWSARLTKPTVNFFLHDVRENVQLRNYQWQRVDQGNGRTNKALLKRPPFRIDCHYMMTCWASEPEDEHKLLTRTMMTLFRFGKLPEEYFQGRMVEQQYDVTTKVAAHDKLTNPAEIWSALDNELRPSVPFSVTITLDPWTPIETPILGSFGLRTARLVDEETGEHEEEGVMTIAGTVRYAPPDEAPYEGATISSWGRGSATAATAGAAIKFAACSPAPMMLRSQRPFPPPRTAPASPFLHKKGITTLICQSASKRPFSQKDNPMSSSLSNNRSPPNPSPITNLLFVFRSRGFQPRAFNPWKI